MLPPQVRATIKAKIEEGDKKLREHEQDIADAKRAGLPTTEMEAAAKVLRDQLNALKAVYG